MHVSRELFVSAFLAGILAIAAAAGCYDRDHNYVSPFGGHKYDKCFMDGCDDWLCEPAHLDDSDMPQCDYSGCGRCLVGTAHSL